MKLQDLLTVLYRPNCGYSPGKQPVYYSIIKSIIYSRQYNSIDKAGEGVVSVGNGSTGPDPCSLPLKQFLMEEYTGKQRRVNVFSQENNI